jgi:hypothetical protein
MGRRSEHTAQQTSTAEQTHAALLYCSVCGLLPPASSAQSEGRLVHDIRNHGFSNVFSYAFPTHEKMIELLPLADNISRKTYLTQLLQI